MKAYRVHFAARDCFIAIKMALTVSTIMLLLSPAVAEDQSQGIDTNAGNRQIKITADKLTTNHAEKYAEFAGDVRASQGEFVITSDLLRIYYKDTLGRNEDLPVSQEFIKRVVASGNVKITTHKYTAETSRVEYDLDTMIFVLDGQNSRIKSGKNILTGSKITVDRKDGQIKVESSSEKRVKAVFYSGEKGFNGMEKVK